jgi:hypothetical protein
MEQEEICCFCERVDRASQLAVWFVERERRSVHTDCWVAAYLRARERSTARGRGAATSTCRA